MTIDTKKLKRLAELAALVAERDLANVAAETANCRQITNHIDDLSTHRRQLLVWTEDPVQSGLQGRQAERLRHAQIAETARLARARVALEHAKDAARPSFGRRAVLDALAAGSNRK